MEEPKVITIDDVIDSTVMHINKGNAFYLDSLNINDLPRHLIIMEEIQISMQEGSGRQRKAVTRSKMLNIDYCKCSNKLMTNTSG